MNIIATLDVAVGLILIYLILSLVVSETQEILAAFFQLRAKNLKQTLITVLGKDHTTKLYEETILKAMNPAAKWRKSVGPSYIEPDIFSTALLQLLKQEQKKSEEPEQKASICSAILQLLKLLEQVQNLLKKEWKCQQKPELCQGLEQEQTTEEQAIPEDIRDLINQSKLEKILKSNLNNLASQAEKNYTENFVSIKLNSEKANFFEPDDQQKPQLLINQFKKEVGDWFDKIMERSSGVYVRTAKFISFVISIIIVVVLNVNTIDIAQVLYTNQPLRSSLATAASDIVENCDPSTQNLVECPTLKEESKKLFTELQTLDDSLLPIGWDFKEEATFDEISQVVRNKFASVEDWIEMLFGWLMSAIAISMGAPYWFDLLSKLTNIRNTGKKPSR